MARALSERVAALYREMHALVRRIPRGNVLTYGQLAELAGLPGGARVAGAAMKLSKGLPWQRVVGKASRGRARIAIHDPVGAALQRQRLEAEGVEISAAGTIDLGRFGWLSADDPPGLRRAARRKRAG
jgi:methylated-DNA-protein-cysteine methyltransferase related protein